MKVLAWVANIAGYMLFLFGLFGLSETDDFLRKQSRLQESVIRQYRAGHSAEMRAGAEERLENHLGRKSFYPDSVVMNVAAVFVGVGLVVLSGGVVYRRKKEAPQQGGAAIHGGPFGSCCKDLRAAMQVRNSALRVEPDDVLFLTVGHVETTDGPGFFDQAVLVCPFCGAKLQDSEDLRPNASGVGPN